LRFIPSFSGYQSVTPISQDGGKFAAGNFFPAFLFLQLPNQYLQDRLRDHAEAFDGLLSLIPAKFYYGKDNSVCSFAFGPICKNIR